MMISASDGGPDPAPVCVPADLGPSAPASATGVRVWLTILAAGLVASALGWLAGEVAIQCIPTEKQGANVNGQEQAIVTVDSSNRSDVKRATLACGLQGALLGLALGLAGAAVRRKGRAAPVAVAGLIGGGIAGAWVSSGLFPIFFRNLDPISGDLLLPLVIHGAVWSAVGAAAGLAFGIGRGGGPGPIARTALAGLAGAALGAIAYQLLGAFFFPQAKSDMPVTTDPVARLLSQALIGLSTAAGVAIAHGPAGRHPARSPDRPAANHQPLAT
jgi:hypothetical protein